MQRVSEWTLMTGDTLVMTATFRAPHTPALVIRDEKVRTLQYLCALTAWSQTRHVKRIVFAENSNTTFDFAPVVRHLEAAGKDAEILVFEGNQGSATFGKGFGEGVILEHVHRNSRLLREAGSFYKVTGRLFVSNFDAISEATTAPDAFRRKRWKDPARRPKVITTFFKSSLTTFERRLLDAYKEVDDRTQTHIEHVYFDRLSDLEGIDLGIKPVIVGEQASTGEVYAPYDAEIVATARGLMPA